MNFIGLSKNRCSFIGGIGFLSNTLLSFMNEQRTHMIVVGIPNCKTNLKNSMPVIAMIH